ncbi:MAG: PucR family transcriptional regulator [Nocardioides sp.]
MSESAATALQQSVGALSSNAMARMNDEMPWFASLGADERSWVGLIVQAGIRGFVSWYRRNARNPITGDQAVAAAVFGVAPRALTSTISLQQTVDLVRLGIDVVEQNIDDTVDPADAPDVHEALLRYAREIAFATAQVYARAAELRGAWDARLEALVVDSVLRSEGDDAVLSRASALGWGNREGVVVVVGSMPSERSETDLFEAVRHAARGAGMDALCGTQGDRLVVVLGGVAQASDAASVVAGQFGDGAVVVGPVVADLSAGQLSARAAVSGHRAAVGWPDAPRPVSSDELLPERVLAGDGHARRHLLDALFAPLAGSSDTLIDTLTAYFRQGTSIEGTARALFVHPNTVRYRLRQATELTGLDPADARHGFAYRIALVLGRQLPRQRP